MKLNLLFTFVCLCIFNSYNQSNNSISLGLTSTGDIPSFVSENYIPNYNWKISLSQKVFQTSSKNDYEFAKQSLMSSGFVLFGTKENALLDATFRPILNQLFPSENVQLFIYKSNYPTLFHIGENTVFITTSLLANVKHEDQLTFLIARELIASKTPVSNTITRNFRCSNLTDLLIFYSFEETLRTKQLDALAYNLFKEKGLKLSPVAASFHLLIDAQLPSSNLPVNVSQLNSPLMEIPSQLFEIKYTSENDLRKKTSNLIKLEEAILERMKTLGLDTESAFTEVTTNSEILSLIEKMKIEKIRFNIASTDYLLALYELFSLQNNFEEIDHLFALTWLGIIDKEFGDISKNNINHFYGDLHGSAGFINFYTLQNGNSRTAIALRSLKDLQTKHSKPVFDRYFTSAVNILAQSNFFKPELYSDKKLSELDEINDNSHLKRDSTNFYLYAISDIIKDGTFSKEKSTMTHPTSVNEDVDVTIMKKRKFSSEKSDKVNSKLENETVQFALTLKEYNYQEQYGLLCFQSNSHNSYSKRFIPVNHQYFTSNSGDQTLISKFDGYYRPQAKKSYFFALTVIGIPYVISDLFIGGQSSWNTYFFIEPKSGFVTKSSQDFYRDYLTKSNIERRINHSILNYEN